MEASKGGEVRRIHIVYFLSLMGRSEEPHLIRVHHLARNGVYLRDVKRWLGELRGKDLAETHAWSYKRLNEWMYKTGYVWQDLLDDDLITPISDNEYVLKGSQILPLPFETSLFGESKASTLNEEIPLQVHDTRGNEQKQKQPLITKELQLQRFSYLKANSQEKLSSEISSDRFTLTDTENESSKVEEDKLEDITAKHDPNHEPSRNNLENHSLHFSPYHHPSSLNKNKNQSSQDNKTDTPETSFSISLSSSSSSKSLSPLKGSSKRFSSGALFRNLITCGALDINDDVTVVLNQADKNVSRNSNNNAQIGKDDRFGGSARNLGSCWNPQQQQNYEARKSCDGKSTITNKNRKKLGEFLNQIPHRPFGGSIFSR